MTFLDRFKGKTSQITKEGVNDILGNSTTHPNTPPNKNINQTFAINLLDNKQTTKKAKKFQIQLAGNQPQQKKLQKINPFSVSNPFYLDQEEKERTQKIKKQKEIKERIERQKKKRKEIEQRMAEFDQLNKEKFSKKQWVRLGGLGPNLGGQDWTKKKQMQSKMMKFAQEIKQINFQRLKRVPFMSYSGLNQESKKDSRTKALQYSRTVPRPNLMRGGEATLEHTPHSESRLEPSQLELLEQNHLKYMSLVRRI